MRDPSPEPAARFGLAEAFPRRLGADARAALSVLPVARLQPAAPFRVLVSGEVVTIPYRIHPAEPSADRVAELPPVQRAIVHCWYTRHHDGRVRQQHLERIIGLAQPWVAPFVVRLIGEYVDEIVQVVRQNLLHALTDPASVLGDVYGAFAAENPRFVARTGQRVASYWDCYHRRRYPTLAECPGHALVSALQAAARRRAAADAQP